MRTLLFVVFLSCAIVPVAAAATLKLDESPANDEQWGYRPAEANVSETTPPSFSWRPQKDIVSWEIECRSRGGEPFTYAAESIEFNVHCPDRIFPSGSYTWRYRGVDKNRVATNWSQERSFTIADSAVHLPLPRRAELVSRIPGSHPRLFVRPEEMPRLRELAKGPMQDRFADLVARWEKLLANPPPTAEPQKYPTGDETGQPRVEEAVVGKSHVHDRRTGRRSDAWPSLACSVARRSTVSWRSESCWTALSGILKVPPATATTTKPACPTRTTFRGPTPSSTIC